jgi:hypothetical protein
LNQTSHHYIAKTLLLISELLIFLFLIQYGVAKGANIVAVKVLASDGTGSSSSVIAGVEYVAQQKNANKSVPMVASMFND